MAISQGQIAFAITFIIIFVIAIFFAYRKDSKKHEPHYKSPYKILLGCILIIFIYWVVMKLV